MNGIEIWWTKKKTGGGCCAWMDKVWDIDVSIKKRTRNHRQCMPCREKNDTNNVFPWLFYVSICSSQSCLILFIYFLLASALIFAFMARLEMHSWSRIIYARWRIDMWTSDMKCVHFMVHSGFYRNESHSSNQILVTCIFASDSIYLLIDFYLCYKKLFKFTNKY